MVESTTARSPSIHRTLHPLAAGIPDVWSRPPKGGVQLFVSATSFEPFEWGPTNLFGQVLFFQVLVFAEEPAGALLELAGPRGT